MGRVEHRLAVATGCAARWWWHIRAGADARVAVRGAAGGREPGWCRRLTEVVEDVAQGRAVGDEGDDPHLGAAERAAQWEDLIEAGQRQRPGLAA